MDFFDLFPSRYKKYIARGNPRPLHVIETQTVAVRLEGQRQLTFNQEGFGEGGNNMLVSAQKVFWLCSFLIFAPHSANAGGDGPNDDLKGIKAISYKTAVEKTVGGDGCKINEDDLNTSLEFVANQSTNLKITQYSRRLGELFSQAAVSSLSDAERGAARKAVAEYMLMPSLLMSIWPLQTQFACAGTISARLSAFVKGSAHIYGTDALLQTPTVEMWSTSFSLIYPQQTFSSQIINIAEQIMKKLVNDWAASQ
jgi:hypothetical protein